MSSIHYSVKSQYEKHCCEKSESSSTDIGKISYCLYVGHLHITHPPPLFFCLFCLLGNKASRGKRNPIGWRRAILTSSQSCCTCRYFSFTRVDHFRHVFRSPSGRLICNLVPSPIFYFLFFIPFNGGFFFEEITVCWYAAFEPGP